MNNDDGSDCDNYASDDKFMKAVILVPTQELYHQVYSTLKKLYVYFEDVVILAVFTNNNINSDNNSKYNTVALQHAISPR